MLKHTISTSLSNHLLRPTLKFKKLKRNNRRAKTVPMRSAPSFTVHYYFITRDTGRGRRWEARSPHTARPSFKAQMQEPSTLGAALAAALTGCRAGGGPRAPGSSCRRHPAGRSAQG